MGGEEDTLEDAEILMDIMEAHEGMAHAETQEEVALIRSENDGTWSWFYQGVLSCLLLIQKRSQEHLEKLNVLWGRRTGKHFGKPQ